MSERLLYYDRGLACVHSMSLDTFSELFEADTIAWGALHAALFKWQRTVKFQRPDGKNAWVAPFNEYSVDAAPQGWTANAVEFERDRPAKTPYRLEYDCTPRLYASAIVEAHSAKEAIAFAEKNFTLIADELHEVAGNTWEDWVPEQRDFKLIQCTAIDD